jgi:UDP-glucose 4-epimerase
MSTNTKIALVTGAAGYLGSHTVDKLLCRGYKVRGIDLPNARFEANLGAQLNCPSLKIEPADILSIDPEAAIFADTDYIFHCAGIADHIASFSEPERYIDVNVKAVVRVLEAARYHNVTKVIYPSSAAVYGTAEWPTSEEHPINPGNPYGFSKWLGELAINHWHQVFGVPSISYRIFNGYGPRAETSGVVGAFLKRRRAEQPIGILGDGSALRDFIYVSDIVDAFLLGAESDVAGRVYNIASGSPRSVKELAELMGCEIEYGPAREGEPPVICGDISKIMTDLGWKPSVSLEDGIKSLLSYEDAVKN